MAMLESPDGTRHINIHEIHPPAAKRVISSKRNIPKGDERPCGCLHVAGGSPCSPREGAESLTIPDVSGFSLDDFGMNQTIPVIHQWSLPHTQRILQAKTVMDCWKHGFGPDFGTRTLITVG